MVERLADQTMVDSSTLFLVPASIKRVGVD
jgi:hypothetical protein